MKSCRVLSKPLAGGARSFLLLVPIAATTSLLSAGCKDLNIEGFPCSTADHCPSPYQCVDHKCVRNGSDAGASHSAGSAGAGGTGLGGRGGPGGVAGAPAGGSSGSDGIAGQATAGSGGSAAGGTAGRPAGWNGWKRRKLLLGGGGTGGMAGSGRGGSSAGATTDGGTTDAAVDAGRLHHGI